MRDALIINCHLTPSSSNRIPTDIARRRTERAQDKLKHSSRHFPRYIKHIPAEQHRQWILSCLFLQIPQRRQLVGACALGLGRMSDESISGTSLVICLLIAVLILHRRIKSGHRFVVFRLVLCLVL